MDEAELLKAMMPVIGVLGAAMVSVIISRRLRLSPIVGYLALGVGLALTPLGARISPTVIATVAEFGVVFLLFDIGLHFPMAQLREQARDILGFGTAQVLLGTLPLAILGWLFGLTPIAALLVGASLSLSSTAVVARVIAERHQQSCPVGRTATSILIFQDIAAIFMLIVAGALGSGSGILPAVAAAVAKAAGAFLVAAILSRFIVRPVLELIASTRNEEMFTATVLVVVLASGWATGSLGLSITLGAFLGGTLLSGTRYRAILQSEVKPFRGLLLGFYFISVGLTLDLVALGRVWPAVLLAAAILLTVKISTNFAAALIFRWSVPGSVQLAFLLAQGSEFAFVILSLPQVRVLVGADRASVVIAGIALTLALTPNVADLGRRLAGMLRTNSDAKSQLEMQSRDIVAPVLIVGMGPYGRAVADALTDFDIGYAAIEEDPLRASLATADGYGVVLGDIGDSRIWGAAGMEGRKVSVLTEPSIDIAGRMTPVTERFFPDLTRVAIVKSAAEAASFAKIGLTPVVETGASPGEATARAVLVLLGEEALKIDDWTARRKARETEFALPDLVPA